MKIAFVYDRINKWGGAERVLLAFQKIFPHAPFYTSVYNSQTASWAKDFKVKTSFLQNIPFAQSAHEKLAVGMPIAFESFSFDEYDVVISITSEAAKGIITKPHTLHICYCLTPTRYLWSGYKEYFSNPFLKTLAEPAVLYLKTWDTIAATRPDVMVGISKEVQNRIKKYYKRESKLIYPPADSLWQIAKSKSKLNHTPLAMSNKPFFLIVSRLVSYKRIDLAIKACNQLKVPLKIIGTGSQEHYLKSIAGPTIEFLGFVSDDMLSFYYQHCSAFIFPGYEDLGLTMVEATSFGKPVVAYDKGGAKEIVFHGQTGILFSEQSIVSLVDALQRVGSMRYNTKKQKEVLSRFSFQTFKDKIEDLINTKIV